jgi:hypothetical protein
MNLIADYLTLIASLAPFVGLLICGGLVVEEMLKQGYFDDDNE